MSSVNFYTANDYPALAAHAVKYYQYKAQQEESVERGFGMVMAGIGALFSLSAGAASLAKQHEEPGNPSDSGVKDVTINIRNLTRLQAAIARVDYTDNVPSTINNPHIAKDTSEQINTRLLYNYSGLDRQKLDIFLQIGDEDNSAYIQLSLKTPHEADNNLAFNTLQLESVELKELNGQPMSNYRDSRPFDQDEDINVAAAYVDAGALPSVAIMASPITDASASVPSVVEITLLEEDIEIPEMNTATRSDVPASAPAHAPATVTVTVTPGGQSCVDMR